MEDNQNENSSHDDEIDQMIRDAKEYVEQVQKDNAKVLKDHPVKNPTFDTRKYRHVTLPNEMQVLFIEDPQI